MNTTAGRNKSVYVNCGKTEIELNLRLALSLVQRTVPQIRRQGERRTEDSNHCRTFLVNLEAAVAVVFVRSLLHNEDASLN